MLSSRVICAWIVFLACVASVRAWRVSDSGSNIHFYDRDKLQQNKLFDLSSNYFNHNTQQWGQMGQFGAPGGGGGGVNGDTGGAGGQYFGDSIVFVNLDNSANSPPRKEKISDGTLDSMQYCKCTRGPECEPSAKQPAKSHYACGAGQILCCYDGHPRYQQLRNSDRYQNDGPYVTVQSTGTVPDNKWNAANEPPGSNYSPNSVPRLPNYKKGINEPSNFENLPPGSMFLNDRPGPASAPGNIKAKKFLNNQPVLVRPGGLAGLSGPNDILNGPNNYPGDKPGLLVGPGGPTGRIGPFEIQNPPPRIIGPGLPQDNPNQRILTGPGGPSGLVGPPNINYHSTTDNRDEIAGHTLNQDMFIGGNGISQVGDSAAYANEDRNTAASAQRGVLVGPGGPTGIIGPSGRDDLPVARKGLIATTGRRWGPNGQTDLEETSASAQRGVLVGPGGPTGIIGPGFGNRPGILVGPGGPTGIIGPYRRPQPYGNRQRLSGFGPYSYRGQKTVFGPNWLGDTPQRGVLVGPGGPTGQIGPPTRQ